MQMTPFLVTAALAATAMTAPAQRAMQPAAPAPMAPAAAMQRAVLPPPPPTPPPQLQQQQQQQQEQRSQPGPDCAPMAVREKDLTPEDKEARAFRKPLKSGPELAKAVGKVTKELVWTTSLADAQKLAQKDGKPILWIQALGTLKGFL